MDYNNGYWPAIHEEGEKKAELFAKKIYELEIPSKHIWFDERGQQDIRRKTDPKMTLEKFFSIKRGSWSTQAFVVGRTTVLYGNGWTPAIEFAWRMSPEKENIEYFYWFTCKYEEGFEKVNGVFRKIYHKNMEDYPRL